MHAKRPTIPCWKRGGLLAGALVGLTLATTPAAAQPGPGSALPNPRLTSVTPHGGKVGSVVEVGFAGTDVEDAQALLFSHAGIKAEPVQPPAPPPPDPKKPPKAPSPPVPITKFKVTIAPEVPVGIHDVRLVNKWGVSNPRAFVVGDLVEVLEKEPNNDVAEAQRVALNSTVNGVISSPTDVDYYVFAGKKGQRVVVSCLASSIDSRLDAALEVYDARGKAIAFNRNYHGTDALTDCTLATDGDYHVRLHSFAHAEGGPDFFYRLSVTTAPWVDAVYPPMVEAGKPAQLTVYGRNLPGGKRDPSTLVDGQALEKTTVTITPPTDPAALKRLTYSGRIDPVSATLDGFEYRLRNEAGSSNPFLLTYARAPVVLDNGANDSAATAQQVSVPCEIAGQIEKKRDRDWYAFTLKKGETYNVELLSHRLGAPADIKFLVRNALTKANLVETVDNPDFTNPMFYTRTSDPAVYRFTAPADGSYQILVRSDNGDVLTGPRQFYRIRITPDAPDFQVVVMPADQYRPDGCHLPRGGSQYVNIFAWRADGWNGDIALSVEGLPAGVTCAPQTLAGNLRHTSLVLTAAADCALWTGAIKVKGTATIKGQKVEREARYATITWPVAPQQGIPALGRLDRSLVLAVRDQAPYHLAATIDKTAVLQGDKATITLKLARLWPDFKAPVAVQIMDAPPNQLQNLTPVPVTVNNNQPLTMAPGKDDGTLPVEVKASVLPGTYNIVLHTQAQVPFNKDPMAKQKPNINVVLPATPITITVLPRTVGTVAVATPSPTVKAGTQLEMVVKVTRLHDYAGEFKVQLVLPANVKGISAEGAVIPAGKDETKVILRAAADAALGPRPDLIVRATALVHGNLTTTQETKVTVNVIK